MFRSMVNSSWAYQTFKRGKRLPPKRKNTTTDSVVVLSSLPTTTTLTDIRSLTYKPPKPTLSVASRQASTPRDSSSSSLAAGITKIDFVRTKMLNIGGRVAVYFRDKDRALEFAETANERVVGGNRIKAQVVDQPPLVNYPIVTLLNALQKQSPGRVVLLKGLPAHFSQGRLAKILSRSYQLAKDPVVRHDEEGQKSELAAVIKLRDVGTHNAFSTFLVRLQTVSGAMMLIRRWHRVVWNTREEEVNKHDTGREKVYVEEADEEETTLESGTDQRRHTQSNWNPRQDDRQPEDELSRVVDAYLMY